jgi:hypothetical protein
MTESCCPALHEDALAAVRHLCDELHRGRRVASLSAAEDRGNRSNARSLPRLATALSGVSVDRDGANP